MMRYNGTVRLAGRTNHHVERSEMSAAEVMVLRAIHGFDAVTNLVEVKNDKSNHAEERARLHQRYGNALHKNDRMSINSLFGPSHVKLPAKIDAEAADEADAPDETVEEAA